MFEGFPLGPLFLRWNGILLALGVAAGALLAGAEARRRKYDPAIIYYLCLPLLIWGTLGARIWYILTPPLSSVQLGLTTHYYLSHPIDALALWLGGYGLPGALIGILIALIRFVRKNHLPFWDMADILAPTFALAQAIGRAGNFFNQELYGLPTDLPWKMFIDPAHRLAGYEAIEYFHPLFAYEVILNLASLTLLLWLSRRFPERLKSGDLFLAYLGLYSAYRFLLEYLRLDIAVVHGINVNQLFFGVLFVSVGAAFLLRHRRAREL